MKIPVLRLGPGVAQHHAGVAGRAHQVVALLDHAAVLAVIEAKFLEPVE